MRVLVACEKSGRVREAFKKLGHDAWSCDLLPTDIPGNHIVGDVLSLINGGGWDLMIAHPPCTYLSYAGTAHWNKPGRAELREAGMKFFMAMVNAPIPKICVENPVGYPNTVYRKPDQIIHPYYFGDPFLKRTCLWLKGLPKLWWCPTDDLFGQRTATDYPEPIYIEHKPDGRKKNRHYVDSLQGGDWNRSITFPGVAEAMATQWGASTLQSIRRI